MPNLTNLFHSPVFLSRMRRKSVSLGLILMLFSSCENKDSELILVKNELNITRKNETVEVHKSMFQLTDLTGYGLEDAAGQQQLVQYVDEDKDGQVDLLLFQPEVEANTVNQYQLVKVDIAGKQEEATCFARFVPERTDDLAWENDKVAFRIFGPTAQQMFEEGVEGGTLSSGVDCWLKRVEYPVINKWYGKYTNKTGSYHEDTGEGLDNFHVGSSRGCGGIAIKKDSTYFISKNFSDYEVLMTGPIRTSFRVVYEDWDAGDARIKESRIVTLDKGSNLSKFEIIISGNDEIAAGLTLHEKAGEVSENSTKNWVSYWEPHGDSELGMGLVTTSDYLQGFEQIVTDKKDLSNVFMKLKVKEKTTTYYAGFGWKKSGQFDSKDDWNVYLSDFSRRLASPLKVVVGP